MKRLCLTMGATLAAAVGLMFPVASADAAASDCTSGRLCMWDDTGFKDTIKQLTAGDRDFHSLGGSNYNDKASSVRNRTSDAWVMYDDTNWQDTSVCVKSGASATDLHDFAFNDKASSIHRLTTNTCPSGVNRIISGAN